MTFISPDQWRAAGKDWQWRDHRIFTRSDGDGAPLLVIHGFPTASWDFAPLWAPLAAQHRLLTLDMLGFGWSDKPRRFDYSIAAQADLFEALLARDGVTRYRILAHDYGNTVAQELLARQRDGTAAARIDGVCFLNGGLFPETHRPILTQRLLASPLGPVVARLIRYRSFVTGMQRISKRPLAERELRGMWQMIQHGDGLGVISKLIGYMAERRRHRERWVGALIHADVPVRLIDGLDDPISGAHMVARYRELIPSPDVVELPGIGHYPQLEAPDLVLAAVTAWLASGSPGSASG